MKTVRFLAVISFFLVLCFGMPAVSYADNDGTGRTPDGVYTAVTADNVQLKMKRYRPSPDAEFNEGRQPVLLFTGIFFNMNQFLTYTPENRKNDYKGMELAEPVAEWAEGDEYIEDDPMLYYSIAHYLWLSGYDPWFANYRGTGRMDMKSGQGSVLTTLDVWGALDVPACVDLVFGETGRYPVIGGHSTGGLVSYAYLQGAYINHEELGSGYIPHVKSDPALAAQRNSNIKGFIGLDPAGVPPMPSIAKLIDLYPMWLFLGMPLYLDFDRLMDYVVNPIITDSSIIIALVDTVFGIISGLTEMYPEWLPASLNIFSYINFWQISNMDPYVEDFFVRYGLSGSFVRALSQYVDFYYSDHIREHWKNGEENKNRVMSPDAEPGEDGYYYYDVNMNLMKVPAICVLSYYDSLVSADRMIKDIMEAKTHNANDEYYIVPDSSHADVPMGLNAPTFSFPRIGAWLNKICPEEPLNPGAVSETSESSEIEDSEIIESDDKIEDTAVEEDVSITDDSYVNSESGEESVFGCGSVSEASAGSAGNVPILPNILGIFSMMFFPFLMTFLHRMVAGKRKI